MRRPCAKMEGFSRKLVPVRRRRGDKEVLAVCRICPPFSYPHPRNVLFISFTPDSRAALRYTEKDGRTRSKRTHLPHCQKKRWHLLATADGDYYKPDPPFSFSHLKRNEIALRSLLRLVFFFFLFWHSFIFVFFLNNIIVVQSAIHASTCLDRFPTNDRIPATHKQQQTIQIFKLMSFEKQRVN